jgi:CubicO group peptidase (beta-lactamase class C family)
MNRRDFLSTAASATVLAPMLCNAAKAPLHSGGIHPPDEKFMTQLPYLMDVAWLPGIAIGVVQHGKTIWQHYAGFANGKTKTPITESSLFTGASCGKPIFACLVLKMAQDGAIDLDRPVNQYLLDDVLTGQWGDKVTPRHVLSHSTGLPNWRGDGSEKLTPAFEPGSRFQYSGEGFFHLQRVVEHITGKGFEALMQEKIFTPLGMTSSTFLWLADADERYVAGHNGLISMYNCETPKMVFDLIRNSGKPATFWTYEQIAEAIKTKTGKTAPAPSNFSPNVAFSLLTTLPDYTRFLAALVDPENTALGLSPATRQAMHSPVSKVNSAISWGLGIGIEQVQGEQYLWQWGDNGGWKNFILVHLPSRTAFASFSNGNNGAKVNDRIVDAATGIRHPAFLWI